MLRTYSQIPVRAKYLLAVADYAAPVAPYPAPSTTSAFTLDAGEHFYVTSVSKDDYIKTGPHGYAPASISATDLYKDMGRQIVIYDDDRNHVAVFRQVQFVNGPTTEGVCSAADRCATTYIKVWSADGDGVVVVRTG